MITHSTLWNGPDVTALFVKWKRRLSEGSAGKRLLFCHMSHFQPPASWRYSLQEREWRRAWNEYSLSRIISEADFLLVTTPSAERDMVEHGARRDQCLLFPGGIEVPPHQGKDELEEFRREHNIHPQAKLVTYLGTVEKRKNVAAIVKVAWAMRRREDAAFVIAGRLEGEYGKKVLAEAREAPNVSVLGEITEEDKAKLIGNSYLNVTLSELEALGLVQLEFMSAGVPVITSGVGGQSWVVRNGQTGIVVKGPPDIVGASAAIARLLDDHRERARLGRNAAKFASGLTMTALLRRLIGKLEKRLGVDEDTDVLAR